MPGIKVFLFYPRRKPVPSGADLNRRGYFYEQTQNHPPSFPRHHPHDHHGQRHRRKAGMIFACVMAATGGSLLKLTRQWRSESEYWKQQLDVEIILGTTNSEKGEQSHA